MELFNHGEGSSCGWEEIIGYLLELTRRKVSCTYLASAELLARSKVFDPQFRKRQRDNKYRTITWFFLLLLLSDPTIPTLLYCK